MRCPHGFLLGQKISPIEDLIQELIDIENGADSDSFEPKTYCSGCRNDVLFSRAFGMHMGILPNIRRKIRNKEKKQRQKSRKK